MVGILFTKRRLESIYHISSKNLSNYADQYLAMIAFNPISNCFPIHLNLSTKNSLPENTQSIPLTPPYTMSCRHEFYKSRWDKYVSIYVWSVELLDKKIFDFRLIFGMITKLAPVWNANECWGLQIFWMESLKIFCFL